MIGQTRGTRPRSTGALPPDVMGFLPRGHPANPRSREAGLVLECQASHGLTAHGFYRSDAGECGVASRNFDFAALDYR
jgi:hypothetical protein